MGANLSHQHTIITSRSELEEELNLFRQDKLISSFINIAMDQTEESARRILQTTNWNINEAINLYYTQKNSVSTNQVQDSRTTSQDSDLSLFPLPSYRFEEDSFEAAKSVSVEYNLWLIVNIQSRNEIASNVLNRDLWGNDAVSGIVQSKFLLWQVYNDSTLGQKICSFYKIESAPPVVLVIDPITGLKMSMWSGLIEAQGFVEDLVKFTENGPREYIASQARNVSMEVLDNYLPTRNNNQSPEPSWGEEFEEEDNSASRHSNEDTWDSRNDDEDTWDPRNNDEDTWVSRSSNEETWNSRNEDTWASRKDNEDPCAYPPPYWGEEFEVENTWAASRHNDEKTWASRNDNEDTCAYPPPSWGEEIEVENTWASRNDNEETWTSRNDNEDTWASRNDNEDTWAYPPPSWGEEFEVENTWASRNDNKDTCAYPPPSWGEEFEVENTWASRNDDEDTWTSRNYNEDTCDYPPPSWGEEFEVENTWSSKNNNDQNPIPSWGQESEDQDLSSKRDDSDDFVPPYIGEEYEEDKACLQYPVLTEEPKRDSDPSLVCSLCVRFPDGKRRQRKFLNSEPIQLLWSFCYSHMDESEEKAFKLVHAIPGASKSLDYEDNVTFEESGLANSMISVTWE